MRGRKAAVKLLGLSLSLCVLSASVLFTPGNALYNDITYENYANLSLNSSVPSLFRNDAVFSEYKSYPPIISDGIEYVPLELFSGLSGVKVSFSDDNTNFYIQNRTKNKYISFSIDGGYAVTESNKVHEVKVPLYHGTLYVPLRVVCSSTGIGCDSYNDGENKIYVIKVYVTEGLSAKELIKIHAPGVYESTPDSKELLQDGEGNRPPYIPPQDGNGESGSVQEDFGRRTLYLAFAGEGLMNVPRIADTLAANGIQASFFVSEKEILEYPDCIRRLYTAGHTLGITFSEGAEQLCAEGGIEESILRAENALYEVIKTKTRLVCLPQASADIYKEANITERIEAMGLRAVSFNFDAKADVLGYAASSASLTEGIKNLENVRRTTNAYIRLSMSEASRLVSAELAKLSRMHRGITFSQITEVH